MTDVFPPNAPPSHVLPQFAPVPRAKDRSNGWRPEVQRAFIEALAETGSVKSAARRVNRAEVGAYLLRRHPEAAEFRKAWDIALDIGMRRIEDVAMDRALHGVEVPMYSYGKLIGTRTIYNDRLLMFMLRNRAPERFAGGKPGGLNAVDQMQLKRLKRQWRQEWEAEHAATRTAANAQGEDEIIEQINAKIQAMADRHDAAMTPATRALHAAWRAAQAADETAADAAADAAAAAATKAATQAARARYRSAADSGAADSGQAECGEPGAGDPANPAPEQPEQPGAYDDARPDPYPRIALSDYRQPKGPAR